MLRKSLLCRRPAVRWLWPAKNDEEAFRDGLPSKEMVEVKAPEKSGQGLTRTSLRPGARAAERLLPAHRGRDGGGQRRHAVRCSTCIEEITKHTPTTIDGDTAVWGPHTGGAQPATPGSSPSRSTGDDTLQLHAGGQGEDGGRLGLRGRALRHAHRRGGRGRRAREGLRLGQLHSSTGTKAQHPARARRRSGHRRRSATRARTPTAVATVEAEFRQVRDEQTAGHARGRGLPLQAATPGAGGEFDFALDKNMDTDRRALERRTSPSRAAGRQTGAGRSDVKLSGGDLGARRPPSASAGTRNFLSRYFAVSFTRRRCGYGTARRLRHLHHGGLLHAVAARGRLRRVTGTSQPVLQA